MIVFDAHEFYHQQNYKAVIQSKRIKIEIPLPFTNQFVNGINPFPLIIGIERNLKMVYKRFYV